MQDDSSSAIEVSVSQFVELFNQTLQYAFPSVILVGELANYRVSRNRWVYFDLKDEDASVKFFGTVYQLPGPLEEGMMLRVKGQPRMHPLYGFSITVQIIQPSGEGSLKRAADLLAEKLNKEGLFALERKRSLPYPPQRIGLVTAQKSAAYADFTKILAARWQGIDVEVIDVLVQGESAPAQIQKAIEYFNERASAPDVLVVIRGGGSNEDLAAFNTEQVTRAVAASRIPTLVAIGHEVDVSLAELAADKRASTPSNAAELLVPDNRSARERAEQLSPELHQLVMGVVKQARLALNESNQVMVRSLDHAFDLAHRSLEQDSKFLALVNPTAILRRGYAIIRTDVGVIRSAQELSDNGIVELQLHDGSHRAIIKDTHET
jgi:exodeoxyribonuclease VII large subunit